MEEKINFEEAMQELEDIANQLEKGDLTLDESVQKFEAGMELSKKLNKVLEDSEMKINILIEKDGEITEKPLVNNE